MAADELVAGLRDVVFTPAVEGLLRLVENPPGRAPHASLVGASEWYRGLDDEGRGHYRFLVEEAAREAVFGLLAVLDEVRAFDGQLRLVTSRRVARRPPMAGQAPAFMLSGRRSSAL